MVQNPYIYDIDKLIEKDTVSKSVSQLSCKKRTSQVWPVLASL